MITTTKTFNQTIEYFKPGTFVYHPGLSPTTQQGGPSLVSQTNFSKSALQKSVVNEQNWRNPTPYSLTSRTLFNWYGQSKIWWAVNTAYHQMYTEFPYQGSWLVPFDSTFPSVPNNWVNRAEVECLNKLKDLNVNYAVALAEARKSLSLIASSAKQLTSAYSAARRGRWKEACRALGINHTFKRPANDLSGRWLEIVYGWLPLLSDIYGAHEDARKSLLQHGQRVSVIRVIKQPVPLPTNLRVTTQQSGFTPVYAKYKHEKGSVYGVKVRLDYEVDNAALASASRAGLLNPATVKWELVPFSFVIDWIFPIGNWLDSFDAAIGLKFLSGTQTKFVRVKRTGKVRYSNQSRSTGQVHSIDLDGRFDYFSMDRIVYQTPPNPWLYWKNPISTSHVANAIALLIQIITRK